MFVLDVMRPIDKNNAFVIYWASISNDLDKRITEQDLELVKELPNMDEHKLRVWWERGI